MVRPGPVVLPLSKYMLANQSMFTYISVYFENIPYIRYKDTKTTKLRLQHKCNLWYGIYTYVLRVRMRKKHYVDSSRPVVRHCIWWTCRFPGGIVVRFVYDSTDNYHRTHSWPAHPTPHHAWHLDKALIYGTKINEFNHILKLPTRCVNLPILKFAWTSTLVLTIVILWACISLTTQTRRTLARFRFIVGQHIVGILPLRIFVHEITLFIKGVRCVY